METGDCVSQKAIVFPIEYFYRTINSVVLFA